MASLDSPGHLLLRGSARSPFLFFREDSRPSSATRTRTADPVTEISPLRGPRTSPREPGGRLPLFRMNNHVVAVYLLFLENTGSRRILRTHLFCGWTSLVVKLTHSRQPTF